MNMPSFKDALENTYFQDLTKAAEGLHQIYCELQKAGFDKAEAMTLLLAMMHNGKRQAAPDKDRQQ